MSATMPSNIDRQVEVFLFDLDVILDNEYAAPGRRLFDMFWPSYPKHAGLPIDEALTHSYNDLSGSARSNAREIVIGAIDQISTQYLGRYRSLVVIDVAQKICPEHLTSRWRKLLALKIIDDRSIWLGELARRWARSELQLRLDEDEVRLVFSHIRVRDLLPVLRWAVVRLEVAGLTSEQKPILLHTLLNARRNEISSKFVDEKIRFSELEAVLVDADDLPPDSAKRTQQEELLNYGNNDWWTDPLAEESQYETA
jgi:hypothetical protein